MSLSGSAWSLIVFGDRRALAVSESHKKKIKKQNKKKAVEQVKLFLF